MDDKIYTSVPVDSTAKKVVSQSNDIPTIPKVGNRICSTVALKTTQFLGPREHDLSGMVKGQLKVIGPFLMQPGKGSRKARGVRWVVKCSCGRYETRNTKSLKKERRVQDGDDCCSNCDYVKRMSEKHRKGIN